MISSFSALGVWMAAADVKPAKYANRSECVADRPGVRQWLRTRSGEGRVKFGLYFAAHSPDHEAREWPQETKVGPAWQRIDLSFRELREGFALGETDLFSIEFAPGEAREFLVDDLQFLGPWRLDGGGGGLR